MRLPAGCPPCAGAGFDHRARHHGYFADTPAQFAEAIQKAAADPACGHAAQRRVNEHFLWANSAETALAMLDKQGGNRRG